MDETIAGRRGAVPLWFFALTVVLVAFAGTMVGRSSLLGPHDPAVVVGEATLANKANWLTIAKADGVDGVLDFDARSVAWVDDSGTYWDGLTDDVPPCLRVNTPARVEIAFVPLPDGGGAVTQVRCLAGE